MEMTVYEGSLNTISEENQSFLREKLAKFVGFFSSYFLPFAHLQKPAIKLIPVI